MNVTVRTLECGDIPMDKRGNELPGVSRLSARFPPEHNR